MRKEVIGIEDLIVSFDGVTVLENVNLSVKENDFLGIIGPNGGGKTTLLKVILGLVKPDKGKISILPGEASPRKYLGYVPQFSNTDHSFPITVMDVVLMGRLGKRGLIRRYNKEDKNAAKDAIEKVGLTGLEKRQIGKLSGGQHQRVLIARALACEPKILLLDEPSASLDSNIGKSLYELFEKLNEHMTLLLVTHDIGVISRHVKQVACMNRELFIHEDASKVDPHTIEKVYGCPVDLITHGHTPHRVLNLHGAEHSHPKSSKEQSDHGENNA